MAASGIAFFIFPGAEPSLSARISTASFCRLRWPLSPATLLKKNFAKFLRTPFFTTPPVAASPQSSTIRALQYRQKKKKERKILQIRFLPKWIYRFKRIFFFVFCVFSVKHGLTVFQTNLFSVTLFTCKKHPLEVFYKNRCS